MKKFNQRSKRGQRRLLICTGVSLSIALIILVHILNTSLFFQIGLNQEGIKQGGDSEEVIGDNNLITPPIIPPEREDEDSLEWLYELVLNPMYSYGSSYNGILLNESALDTILRIDVLTCDTISINDVGLGDIAICGSYVGICVGQYDDTLLFAYISSVASEILPAGGVYLGFSMEQKDEALYGMRPIPFEIYYNTSTEEASSLDFRLYKKIMCAAEKMQWYENLVYYYGRMMSECCVSELTNSLPKKLLAATHLVVDEKKFRVFLEKFSVYAESICSDYSFTVARESAFDDYSIFTVNCVSMEPDSLFNISGEWKISVYQTEEFIPCIAPQINKYAGICGFTPEKNEMASIERTEEELIRDKQMFDAGFELQADGTYIYHCNGYSIIIDPNTNDGNSSEETVIIEEISSTERLIFQDDLTDEEIARLMEEINMNLPYEIKGTLSD